MSVRRRPEGVDIVVAFTDNGFRNHPGREAISPIRKSGEGRALMKWAGDELSRGAGASVLLTGAIHGGIPDARRSLDGAHAELKC